MTVFGPIKGALGSLARHFNSSNDWAKYIAAVSVSVPFRQVILVRKYTSTTLVTPYLVMVDYNSTTSDVPAQEELTIVACHSYSSYTQEAAFSLPFGT